MSSNRVTCNVCFEPLKGRQPKILPCLHSFCSPCLDQIVEEGKNDQVLQLFCSFSIIIMTRLLLVCSCLSQVHIYKVSHGNFHSVRTYMISRETSVFTSHPRRKQCVLRQECVPLPVVYYCLSHFIDLVQLVDRFGPFANIPLTQNLIELLVFSR